MNIPLRKDDQAPAPEEVGAQREAAECPRQGVVDRRGGAHGDPVHASVGRVAHPGGVRRCPPPRAAKDMAGGAPRSFVTDGPAQYCIDSKKACRVTRGSEC